MDIWIIQDGEKTGPLHDFEIRRKIETGELAANTPAWHDGLDSWKPLGEIDLFAREFELVKPTDETPAESSERPRSPLPATNPYLIRRFWARWFDLHLYSGAWLIIIWAMGCDIGAVLSNPWIILFRFVPWFIIEAILLSRFGITPGKWLLGIRIVNDDGRLLSLQDAIRRSMRVLFLGIGFGWIVLSPICQLLAYFTTRKLGKPLWDHAGGHHLEAGPLNPLRLTFYVVGLFAALQLQMIVVGPYAKDDTGIIKKMFPQLSEELEKNPPWHLPKNH
jgi:uncharacterized RDD family membrane protein YckC